MTSPPPQVIVLSTGRQRVHLRAARGHYLCADFGQGGLLLANRNAAKAWETFIFEDHKGFSAIICEGKYLSADNGGGGHLHANRDRAKV